MMLIGKRCGFKLVEPVNRMVIMWESGCFLVRSYDFNLAESMMVIWDATTIYSYRIMYEVKNNDCFVLAIVHRRRDFSPEDLP